MKTELFDNSKEFDSTAWSRFSKKVLNLEKGKWELVARKPKRTARQNNSVHKFCRQVANELNGVGAYRKTVSVLNGRIIEHKWTMEWVKEEIWRPVQIAETGKKSSTDLTTSQVDKVADPIIRLLTTQFHFGLMFPSQLSKQLEAEAWKRRGGNGGKPLNSSD